MFDEMGQKLVSGDLDQCKHIRWVGGPRKSWFWQNNFTNFEKKSNCLFCGGLRGSKILLVGSDS